MAGIGDKENIPGFKGFRCLLDMLRDLIPCRLIGKE
jgi:hypothetical protein